MTTTTEKIHDNLSLKFLRGCKYESSFSGSPISILHGFCRTEIGHVFLISVLNIASIGEAVVQLLLREALCLLYCNNTIAQAPEEYK